MMAIKMSQSTPANHKHFDSYITVAKMESQSVSKRTIHTHTKQYNDVLQLISGSSSKAISTQITHRKNH